MSFCLSKRALFFTALFFFFTSAIAQKKVAVESSAAVIERAQNLILQKDRHQALSLLARALQRESGKGQSQAELKRASIEMSRLFLSDKTQQAYEVALSLRRLEPAQAQARLQEVLKQEPENALIVLELAQVHILRSECNQALELIERTLALIPFDEELILAQVQALVCLKKYDHPLILTISQQVKRSGSLQVYWLLSEMELANVETSRSRSVNLLSQLIKLDPLLPQISYWRYRIEENKKNALNSAQKYVMTCQNMTSADYRKYSKDPQLCKNIGEFENEIKASLSQQD